MGNSGAGPEMHAKETPSPTGLTVSELENSLNLQTTHCGEQRQHLQPCFGAGNPRQRSGIHCPDLVGGSWGRTVWLCDSPAQHVLF